VIRHVVVFRWTEDASPESITAVAEALGGLPAVIPSIRRYEFGADLGLLPGRADFALVAEFDTEEDYLSYADHSDHRAVIEDVIDPIRASTVSVQYRV